MAFCDLVPWLVWFSPDVDIQYIGGADPEMVFLDKDYNEVEVRPTPYLSLSLSLSLYLSIYLSISPSLYIWQ